ncbi:hypothetical protein QTG56_25925 (plasmid) [Rossellomorea sp. AcN35-11]|nr:hypothetical protein [Rossellomorea aquimaris]WJV32056.1 hypothetical protein QTG56_25925 [Rossellomorea sp. AcN35-11]
MNESQKPNLWVILMGIIGVPLCTITPSLNLPAYIQFPAQAFGLLFILIGLPLAIAQIQKPAVSENEGKDLV